MTTAKATAHYMTLDGLRGVAAITVVAHHVQNAAGLHAGLFRAGYLSVDFFFALSGFVIAAAYEGKFATGMGFREFAAVRFRRLYPMMVLGSLIGAGVMIASGSPLPWSWALFSTLTLDRQTRARRSHAQPGRRIGLAP